MFKCDLDKAHQNCWCLWAIARAALFAKYTEISAEYMISVWVCLVNVCGVNDCIEWKTEKCHESTNIQKLRITRIMMVAVHYVASSSGLGQFQAP